MDARSENLQLDRDQFGDFFDCSGRDLPRLRGAPVVDVGDLVDAGDGAVGGAALLGEELALEVFAGVLGERDAGEAALLRAVVDEAVFADVEVA
jgi:hypothetical protein